MRWLFEPGLWSSSLVQTAFVIGGFVAVVVAVVGVFVVIRGQSFAGHALSDVATAGGAGAFLAGVPALVGFVSGGFVGAGAMEAIGVQRVRGRDLATGIVLGAATGCSALFFYLTSVTTSSNGATQVILFGSIFTIASSIEPAVFALGASVLVVVSVIVRPLLFSSVNSDLAVVRGVNLRLMGWWFMGLLAVAVGLASIVLGSILATALLIGPAAAALRLTGRVSTAVGLSVLFGVGATWLGTVLAYDSPDWSSSRHELPASFFIVVVIVATYTVASIVNVWRRRRLVPIAPRSR